MVSREGSWENIGNLLEIGTEKETEIMIGQGPNNGKPCVKVKIIPPKLDSWALSIWLLGEEVWVWNKINIYEV